MSVLLSTNSRNRNPASRLTKHKAATAGRDGVSSDSCSFASTFGTHLPGRPADPRAGNDTTGRQILRPVTRIVSIGSIDERTRRYRLQRVAV